MELFYAARSDTGKVRDNNEDFFFADKINNDAYLFIVADGMGGHKSGEVASYKAVTAFVKEMKKSAAPDIAAELKRILLKVNNLLLNESARSEKNRGMGTTLSVLYIKAGAAYIAHVGDSRVYSYLAAGAALPARSLDDTTPEEEGSTPRPLRGHLPASLKEGNYRKPALEQLTEDHSLVGKFVRDGFITKEEALTHPKRNVLYQSVGLKKDINVQTLGPLPLPRGQKFLLCSDGLTNEVSDAEIEKFLRLKSTKSAAEGLIKKARTGRAGDNITVVVVSTQKDEAQTLTDTVKTMALVKGSRRSILYFLLLILLILLLLTIIYFMIAELRKESGGIEENNSLNANAPQAQIENSRGNRE